MTTERFDIEVHDSVAKSIRTELVAIGGAARSTHELVRDLNRELSSGARAAAASAQTAAVQASGAAAQTAAAQAKATAATARATAAQAKLTSEQAKAGMVAERLAQAEAKTALAKQKVATEAARTAEAQSRANIAFLKEEQALDRAVAAEQKAIKSKNDLAAATDNTASAQRKALVIHDRTTVPQGTGANLGGYAGSRSAAAEQDKAMNVQGLRDVLKPGGKSPADNIEEVGVKAQMASHHLLNLGYQLNDIFVSLASGQKPMMVFIQQGAQIGQIAAQSGQGIGGMAKAAGGLLVRALTSATGLITMGAVAIGTLVYASAQGTSELNNLTNGLALTGSRAGMTAGEIYQLSDSIADNADRSRTSIRAIAAEYATSGRFSRAAVADLTAATDKFARLTGQASDEVAAEWTKMADGPTKFAVELAKSYDLLTAKQVDEIRTLEEQGAKQAATDKLAQDLSKTLQNQTVQVGYLEQAWNGLSNSISNAWDALKRWGAEEQPRTWNQVVGDLEKEINTRKARIADNKDGVGYYARYDKERLATAEKELATAKQWQAVENKRRDATQQAARDQRDGIAAQDHMLSTTKGLADQSERAANAVKEYRSDIEKMRKAGLDVPSAAEQAAVEKKLRQQYMPSERPHRTPKGPKPWNRAQNLQNDEADLDVLISNLGEYGDALERANMLESIAAKYRDHNVALTDKETASLSAKILKIQEGRKLQEAMAAIDQRVNGAQREYNLNLEAASKLLAAGKINQEQYNAQLKLMARDLEDATNPLAAMNRELERNKGLVSSYGDARNLREYVDQLKQAAEAQGKSIYKQEPLTAGNDNEIVVSRSKQYTPEVQKMLEEFQRQEQTKKFTSAFERIDPKANEDVGSASYILDHQKELYAEIQRLREEDVANEEEANRRKRNLDRALKDARLETMSGMFGQLASLQTSHNRTVAALGKAAAIAQATIDGYRAVQSALAGPPGPPWSFAIAAVTGAMTVANVAKIAGVGFQRGGYTGDGNPGDVAGPAHRGEFYFDAAATRRIGVPALEALRSGRTFQPANDAGRSGPTVVVRPQPGVYVEERMTSTGEIELIAERVARRVAPDEVAKNIHKSPNSKVSKAMQTNYGVTRERS